MQQQEINTMIELLEKEITRLNDDYRILLKQDKKFPELKNIRMQLKQTTEKLRLFKLKHGS